MRNNSLTDIREKLSTQDRANGSSYFNIDTLYEGITRISNIISSYPHDEKSFKDLVELESAMRNELKYLRLTK